VPVIGFVQVGVQAMAERYTYLPFIGLFIAVVWLVSDAVANFPKLKIAAQLLAFAVIVTCAVTTDAQVRVWKNTMTLFSHVVQVDPRGELPNSTLGVYYLKRGDLAESLKYFDQALLYNNLGTMTLSYSAYGLMQTHDRSNILVAGQRIERALQIDPNDAFTLADMALWSALMGKPADEEIYSRKALARDPHLASAHLYLADALQAQGKYGEAAQQCRQALVIEPENSDAHSSLGVILNQQGLKQQALDEFQRSLAIQPGQANIHYKIGSILLEMHRFPEAIAEFNQSLRFDPADAHTHNDLGVALSQLGDYASAAEQFNRAAQLDTAYADARQNLALAQAMMKNKKTPTVKN
jgi:tetratricopeptide (TPR) repeat protein